LRQRSVRLACGTPRWDRAAERPRRTWRGQGYITMSCAARWFVYVRAPLGRRSGVRGETCGDDPVGGACGRAGSGSELHLAGSGRPARLCARQRTRRRAGIDDRNGIVSRQLSLGEPLQPGGSGGVRDRHRHILGNASSATKHHRAVRALRPPAVVDRRVRARRRTFSLSENGADARGAMHHSGAENEIAGSDGGC